MELFNFFDFHAGWNFAARKGNLKRRPQRLAGELLFDQLMQIRRDIRLIEALNDFVQETGNDEALGDVDRNAAGAEIEEFVFVDLARGGAVRATDVVSQNFEAGH
jgi:hypothetical protein